VAYPRCVISKRIIQSDRKYLMPGGIRSFHRAHLLNVLHKAIPPNTVHFSKGISSYSNDPSSSKVSVRFVDGSSETCDLLIASDGLYSSVRAEMYKKLIAQGKVPDDTNFGPLWTGSALFRAMMSYEELKNKNPEHKALTAPQMLSLLISFNQLFEQASFL
jgi:salicylate hydroxylase